MIIRPTAITTSVPAGSRNPANAATTAYTDDVFLESLSFGNAVTFSSGDSFRAASRFEVLTGRSQINAEWGDADNGSDGDTDPFTKAGFPNAPQETTDPAIQDRTLLQAFNSRSLTEMNDGEGGNTPFSFRVLFTAGIKDNSAAVDGTPELVFFERGGNDTWNVQLIIGGTFENPVLSDNLTISSSTFWRTGVFVDTQEIGSRQEITAGGFDLNDWGLAAGTVVYGLQFNVPAGQGPDLNGFFASAVDPDSFAAPLPDPSNPAIALDKTLDRDVVTAAGQPVTYTYTLTNPGGVFVSDVTLVDDNGTPGDPSDDFTPDFVGGDTDRDGTLDPDETWIYTKTVTFTQEAIDAGLPVNSTAVADSLETGPVRDDVTVRMEAAPGALDFQKSVAAVDAAGNGVLDKAGDVITYTLTVTNTGGQSLTGVTVVDPLTGAEVAVGTLAPGASRTIETTYAITQDDIDGNGGGDGLIDNTATADSDQTEAVTESASVPVVGTPGLTFSKTVIAVDEAGNGILDRAGDAIAYNLTVTNTGNTTLRGVKVKDPLTGLKVKLGALEPGASKSLTAEYELTQRDIDSNGGGDGDLDNRATAKARRVDKIADTTSTPVVREASVALEKTANVATFSRAGEIILYTYTVQNTGNVTLTDVSLLDDAFTFDDPSDDFAPTLASGDVDGDGRLDVGETWVFTAEHTVTAADLRGEGVLTNIATLDTAETDAVTDDATVTAAIDRCTDVSAEFNRGAAGQNPTQVGGNGTNGNDRIQGTAGNDAISANEGTNVVVALGGDDVVNGGNSTDEIYGDGGNDILNGNGGNDLLSGGDGSDRIYGGGGNDVIDAGAGDDLVEAGDGNDRVHMGAGNDTVQGEGGDDCIAGGADRGTVLTTGAGTVQLQLGDELFGNGGADTFEHAAGDGVDFLFDFKAADGDTIKLFGIDPSEATAVQASTPYGPAAALAFDTDGDGAFDGAIAFQQIRDTADLDALIKTGVIEFV